MIIRIICKGEGFYWYCPYNTSCLHFISRDMSSPQLTFTQSSVSRPSLPKTHSSSSKQCTWEGGPGKSLEALLRSCCPTPECCVLISIDFCFFLTAQLFFCCFMEKNAEGKEWKRFHFKVCQIVLNPHQGIYTYMNIYIYSKQDWTYYNGQRLGVVEVLGGWKGVCIFKHHNKNKSPQTSLDSYVVFLVGRPVFAIEIDRRRLTARFHCCCLRAMKRSLSHVCRQDSSLQGPGATDPALGFHLGLTSMWIVWIKFGPTFGRSGTRETWDDPQQPYGFFGRAAKKWCFLWESSRVHFNDLKLTTRADTRQLIFERGFRLPSVWSWRKDTSRTKVMIYDMMDLALQFFFGGKISSTP